MRRRVRTMLRLFGVLFCLLLTAAIAVLLILPSQWFHEKVRNRIISEVERASGGKAEIGSFRFDWKTLTAEVSPFILHGTEPAGEPPLIRADSLTIKLKIISALKRDIDIESFSALRPALNFTVDENGRTNLPQPRVPRQSAANPVEQLVKLAVRQFTVVDGTLRYADRKIPFTLRGQDLDASLSYDALNPSYLGDATMSDVVVDALDKPPLAFSLQSKVRLTGSGLTVETARLAMKQSTMHISGTMQGYKDPSITADVQAVGALSELGNFFRLPPPHVGHVTFTGKATYNPAQSYSITGRTTGRGLAVRDGAFSLAGMAATAEVTLTPGVTVLRNVNVAALDGKFTGMVEIRDFKTYRINGRMDSFSVESLAGTQGIRNIGWNGNVSGLVEATGSFGRGARDAKVAGRFNIAPLPGRTPVKGFVEVAYDQRLQSIQLGKSWVELPSSRADVSGTLGKFLTVRVESRDLNDLLPALAMASPNAPRKFPVDVLSGGAVLFTGTVDGPLVNPKITGTVTASSLGFRGQHIQQLAADVDATRSGIRMRSIAVGQDQLRLTGALDVTLENWKFSGPGPLQGQLRLENASVSKLLTEAGQKFPVDGQLSASAILTGTAGQPRAVLKVQVRNPTLYGEKFDSMNAEIRYAGAGVEVIDAVVELGQARILIDGAYEHSPNDWRNGIGRFKMSTRGFTVQRVASFQKLRPGVQGQFDLTSTGIVLVRDGEILPQTINGDLRLADLVVDGRPIGSFNAEARTEGTRLALNVAGNLRGSKVTGSGEFQLTGNYQGRGQIDFSSMTLATVQDLALASRGTAPLPLDGLVEGRISFSGPAREPRLMSARLELPVLQIVPARRAMTDRQRAELSLQNQGPVVVDYDRQGIHVRSARLLGKETNFDVTGTINTGQKQPWDLRVNGNVNLAVLQNFNEEVVSGGQAVVSASVRGTLEDPSVGGRIELKNASFYLSDMPNGVDQANGLILFDQRRATIEKLTAQTGGGDLSVSGFVGFGKELVYQLQARADRVRVRYPEGVSTSLNASLTYTGTTSRSLMSGVVTVLRAGFNPRTDVASILAATARPVATPATPNEFFRNMTLDVRVETVPNLQFQTSLTSDLQAEADLRLRGTAAKPVLLGRVNVTQGEIQFFGNKYTINRGEIGFHNPVKIEPTVDMDLETRVRGVLVNINFAGPMNKLNVSYRSDPPLQSSDIIALLAVGRAPGSNSSLASGQTVASQGILSTGGNTLLGQAVAAPISGRLQRFFGVSRLKIDPQLTGVNAIPQARLTLEQQISRNITLTYITNLAEANQQIIRLEWDINRNWSLVAIREENGVFGVDFFYKKRI